MSLLRRSGLAASVRPRARAACGCSRRRCWRAWRRSSSPPPGSTTPHPGLGLRPRLRRGGHGRRHRRLVRGHRPVPPPARPADPAHRDHPAQQGPDRRHARRLPQRQFPHPLGGRAADARARRRRRGRPLPGPAAGGRGAPARRAARGCSPTSSSRSTRSGSAAWSRARSPSACARIEIAPLLGQTLEAAITERAARADGRRHRHLGRPHARRQRGSDPRHGPPARRLRSCAGRARREARRRDRRRPAGSSPSTWRSIPTIRCAPRPRRASPASPRDLQHDPEMRAQGRGLEERDDRE